MITFAASADDMGRVRFAVSPLGEAVASLRVLGAPGRGGHLAWADEVVPRLRRADLQVLRALVPPSGYVPDFLTPAPVDGPGDVHAQLEVVAATDPAALADEIAWMATDPGSPDPWRAATAPLRERLVQHPERTVREVVDALRTYWCTAVDPYWRHVQARLRADVRHRMAVVETGGVAPMFSSLHPRIGWGDGRLSVRSRYDLGTDMGGQGLVLVPSVFSSAEVLTMVPPLVPMVVYPLPGPSALHPAPGPDADAAPPLGALLGTVRAAVLQAVRAPRSTTAVAHLVGVTPGAVSQHLGALRACGLVTSARHGRQVLHSLSELGDDLVRGPGAI